MGLSPGVPPLKKRSDHTPGSRARVLEQNSGAPLESYSRGVVECNHLGVTALRTANMGGGIVIRKGLQNIPLLHCVEGVFYVDTDH